MTLTKTLKRTAGLVCTVAAASVFVAPSWSESPRSSAAVHVEPLIATSTTVLGQPITYPHSGKARITSAIVELQPGEKTGLHRHDAPMFGFILSGEVTVDYQGEGARTYRAGEALMEAVGTPHFGYNSGTVPTRILTVFIGAEGTPNTEMLN